MIEYILDNNFQTERNNTILTIGNFDGLHVGHHQLIKYMKTCSSGRRIIVLTFTPHPFTFFSSERLFPLTLANLKEKKQQILNSGVDRVVIQKFDQSISALEPEEFLKILKEKLSVTTIIAGKNFRFGKGRQGDRTHIEAAGIELIDIQEVLDHHDIISSSRIRKMIQEGDLIQANQLLITPFGLTGTVIKGFQRGRQLGFPTANLEIKEDHQIIPPCGIYLSQVKWNNQVYPALTSIGYNPTFNNKTKTVETFLIDFNDNLYGQEITVLLQEKIRNEEKFESIELLIEQMNKDLDIAKVYFKDQLSKSSKSV